MIPPITTALLAAAIFVADTATDLEIAVAVFYVAVVLLSLNFCRTRGVWLVFAGCVALTVLSFALTRTGSLQSGLINCIISISAIGATTYLALKIESAKAAVHEARAQLAHVARVTTLGELTASIGHEVNQPITGVVTSGNACLRWLSAQPPNLEKAKQAVERMLRDANRASDIIGRIRGLAKRAPPEERKWLSINDVILETLALTRSEIEKSGISLQMQLAEDIPLALADRIQLQQVILNLTINAIEAMSADGPRQLLIRTVRDGTGSAIVAIHDSGGGLEAGKIARLFDAFYTTKREGMGLGLTISRSIVEMHGGRLWAETGTPRGAVFQFTLPIEGKTVA
ncbi:ATP-binding protein [Bradyrhizobium sp. LHD-71]|uniref:sensor histidine kinase n=1 Tax=Bradyrhizobium sp. LHD-71 TaxID=3072141 RepID=UPI00280C7667|nr:ATP-binding protein [Bradyrhizobium sp. LHD-71]MDQ8726293.1 ATP-binding protein [Bradyrhizobium sp. LHD-71]